MSEETEDGYGEIFEGGIQSRIQGAGSTDLVRLPGYASAWPALQRMALEQPLEENRSQRIPPSPAAVDRMLETIRWMQWLDTEARHLVWMRADRWDWQEICSRFGCNRSTAWRRRKKALQIVADQLNLLCKMPSKLLSQPG